MGVSLPIDPAYFFECTGRARRLLLWLPPGHLKKLADQRKAKRGVLRDFPHGMDVKVTAAGFAQLKEEYGIELDLDPDAVRLAFDSLVEKQRKPALRSGLLRKDFLDDVAQRVARQLGRADLPVKADRREKVPRQRRRKEFRERLTHQKKARRVLRDLAIPGFREEEPLLDQSAARVKMSKGEKPGEVFLAARRFRKKK